jgi:hypothetical protein
MGKRTPIYYYIFAEEDLEDVGKLLRDLEGSGVLISHNIKGNRRRYRKKISRMALERWGRVAILWGDLDEMLRKTVIYTSNVI